MPEREITEEQMLAVLDWFKERGTEIHKYRLSLSSSHGGIIQKVNGEPLVMYGPFYPGPEYNSDSSRIICSDKLAKELEETGIVSFSEAEVSES